jgi:hypothetical protein
MKFHHITVHIVFVSLLNNKNADIPVHNLVGLSYCSEDIILFSLSSLLVMA